MKTERHRFDGHILGVGTPAGRRFVVGSWQRSPFGAFSDVMVAHPDGSRELLAPSQAVAAYVSDTYVFDAVTITDVEVVQQSSRWSVAAGPLRLDVTFGRRLALGYPLLLVRGPIVHPLVSRTVDPVARRLMPGVRTHGSAGHDKHEYYVARDLRRVTELHGTWADATLGGLTDVVPEPRFGFSSTPRTPALTTVTTFIDLPASPA